MYSVSFLSFDSFKSPKRNTDLAANKKPIPSQLPVITKMNTKMRSNMPMYLPALFNDSSSSSYKPLDQLDISSFITIPETTVMKSMATK